MSSQLSSIVQACGEINMPGLASFQYVEIEGIDTFPEFRTSPNTINQAITLLSGYSWLDGAAVVDSLEYVESQKNSSQGVTFDASLKGVISKDTPAISELFTLMKNHLYIVLYKDKNGNFKLIGSPEEPVSFKSNLKTGKTAGDQAGHDYSFNGVFTEKAPFYVV